MSEQKFIARQGDILILQIASLPANAQNHNSKIIAEGEGHHEHKVIGDVDVFERKEKTYLAVKASGKLVHVHRGTEITAEHLAIDLPVGFYKVIRQRQYNPYMQMIEKIRD